MKISLYLKISLLLLTLIFFHEPIFAQTTVESSFVHDGEERTYSIYIPEMYDESEACPLVFNLHGYGSNKETQEAYGDFRPIADTANFIIVHPQGIADVFGQPHWNCLGTSEVDDVSFISDLIAIVSSEYNIDENRIYSTGMSNGGFMSYKLACQLSEKIAAVASVTGTMNVLEYESCNTNHPMPAMHIHGDNDGTVSFEGGPLTISVEDVVNHWVNFNECDTEPVVTDVPDLDPGDGCTATHYIYENGLLGTIVEYFEISGGEHTWPGSDIAVGITNQDFHASTEIWRFFSQYTLSSLTSSIADTPVTDKINIYPNPSANGNIFIDLGDAEKHDIEVYDALGQQIMTYKDVINRMEIVLPNSGVYFLSVHTGEMNMTEKIIVL